MAYKCSYCGFVFDEDDIVEFEETHGLDCPPYQKLGGCPKCKSGFEETVKCDVCDGDFLEEELIGGVCDCCVEKYQNDFNVCFKIGMSDNDNIKLNCFLASMFDKEEIEEILFKELKEREKNIKNVLNARCERFVQENREWFAERLVEEVRK